MNTSVVGAADAMENTSNSALCGQTTLTGDNVVRFPVTFPTVSPQSPRQQIHKASGTSAGGASAAVRLSLKFKKWILCLQTSPAMASPLPTLDSSDPRLQLMVQNRVRNVFVTQPDDTRWVRLEGQ